MEPEALLPIGLAALAITAVILRRLSRSRWTPTHCEYWIYYPSGPLPKLEEVMKRLIPENPYVERGWVPIGAREGLLMSDIRLHIGLVLRAKNVSLFRPDLELGALSPSAEQLAALARCQSLVRVRYFSPRPTEDLRHLVFLPHLAAAYSDLVGGQLIFDTVGHQLRTPSEFEGWLRNNRRLESSSEQVRVEWIEEDGGGYARTRGMIKAGLPELQTPLSPIDHRTLIESLMNLLYRKIWTEKPTFNEEIPLQTDLDHFVARPRVISSDRVEISLGKVSA